MLGLEKEADLLEDGLSLDVGTVPEVQERNVLELQDLVSFQGVLHHLNNFLAVGLPLQQFAQLLPETCLGSEHLQRRRQFFVLHSDAL